MCVVSEDLCVCARGFHQMGVGVQQTAEATQSLQTPPPLTSHTHTDLRAAALMSRCQRRTCDGDAGGRLDGVGASGVPVGGQTGVQSRLVHRHFEDGQDHLPRQRLLHGRIRDLEENEDQDENQAPGLICPLGGGRTENRDAVWSCGHGVRSSSHFGRSSLALATKHQAQKQRV